MEPTNPKKKIKSKFKTSKSEVDNSGVFILPPDVLLKLGIDLKNINKTTNSLTASTVTPGNGTNETFQKPLKPKPKLVTLNTNNVQSRSDKQDVGNKKQETSITETAALMRESVFLSPTFMSPIATRVENSMLQESPMALNSSTNNDGIGKGQNQTLIITESEKMDVVKTQTKIPKVTNVLIKDMGDHFIQQSNDDHLDEAYLSDCSNSNSGSCGSADNNTEINKNMVNEKTDFISGQVTDSSLFPTAVIYNNNKKELQPSEIGEEHPNISDENFLDKFITQVTSIEDLDINILDMNVSEIMQHEVAKTPNIYKTPNQVISEHEEVNINENTEQSDISLVQLSELVSVNELPVIESSVLAQLTEKNDGNNIVMNFINNVDNCYNNINNDILIEFIDNTLPNASYKHDVEEDHRMIHHEGKEKAIHSNELQNRKTMYEYSKDGNINIKSQVVEEKSKDIDFTGAHKTKQLKRLYPITHTIDMQDSKSEKNDVNLAKKHHHSVSDSKTPKHITKYASKTRIVEKQYHKKEVLKPVDSDKVKEIADLLAAYSKRANERKVDVIRKETFDKYSTEINQPNILKCNSQGIEKPGGYNKIKPRVCSSKVPQAEYIVVKPVKKKYVRVNKSNVKEKQVTPMNTLPFIEEHDINWLSQNTENAQSKVFCICCDFGKINYFSSIESSYEHLHFWNKEQTDLKPSDVYGEVDYVQYIENQLNINSPVELINNKNSNILICWSNVCAEESVSVSKSEKEVETQSQCQSTSEISANESICGLSSVDSNTEKLEIVVLLENESSDNTLLETANVTSSSSCGEKRKRGRPKLKRNSSVDTSLKAFNSLENNEVTTTIKITDSVEERMGQQDSVPYAENTTSNTEKASQKSPQSKDTGVVKIVKEASSSAVIQPNKIVLAKDEDSKKIINKRSVGRPRKSRDISLESDTNTSSIKDTIPNEDEQERHMTTLDDEQVNTYKRSVGRPRKSRDVSRDDVAKDLKPNEDKQEQDMKNIRSVGRPRKNRDVSQDGVVNVSISNNTIPKDDVQVTTNKRSVGRPRKSRDISRDSVATFPSSKDAVPNEDIQENALKDDVQITTSKRSVGRPRKSRDVSRDDVANAKDMEPNKQEQVIKNDVQVNTTKRRVGRPRKIRDISLDSIVNASFSNDTFNDNTQEQAMTTSDVIQVYKNKWSAGNSRMSRDVSLENDANASSSKDMTPNEDEQEQDITKSDNEQVNTSKRGRHSKTTGRHRKTRGGNEQIVRNDDNTEEDVGAGCRKRKINQLSESSEDEALITVKNRKIEMDNAKNGESTTVGLPCDISVEKGEDFEVQCGVCDKNIRNSFWHVHRWKEHAYLAWKKGETPLDLSDGLAVYRYLCGVLKKEGLVCPYCNTNKYPKSFEAHIELCRQMGSGGQEGGEVEETAAAGGCCGVCGAPWRSSAEWLHHNRHEHGYLAWRDTEQPMNIEDPEEVKAHLTKVSAEFGRFICTNCDRDIKGVVTFMEHRKKCVLVTNKLPSPNTDLRKVASVTCALCMKSMKSEKWSDHSINNHYNLAWPVGGASINWRHGNDIVKHMKGYFTKFQAYKCLECGVTRASALGLYAHIVTCNKSSEDEMEYSEECKLCKKTFLCLYQMQHANKHAQDAARRERITQESEERENSDEQLPRQRRAATKARVVIQKTIEEKCKYRCEICDFASDIKVSMDRHKCNLDFDPGNKSDLETESSTHESDDENCDDNDSDSSQKERATKGRLTAPIEGNLLADFKHYLKQGVNDFWTQYYTKECMYPEWQPSEVEWVDKKTAESYFPTVETSCNLKLNNEKKWQTLQRFEAVFSPEVMGLFPGAAASCVCFAPGSRAALAVACHRGAEVPDHYHDNIYTYPNMLQIWDFRKFSTKPTLTLGLLLEFGAVWAMSWCPSGGSSDSRLGLIAIACSNGLAYIFAIPNIKENIEEAQFCKLKPSVELRLHRDRNKITRQATGICWSEHKDNYLVAVGYADGTLAYYDLTTRSPLLRTEEDGVIVITPFRDELMDSSSVTSVTSFPSQSPTGLTVGVSQASRGFSLTRTARVGASAPGTGIVPLPMWPVFLSASSITPVSEVGFTVMRRVGVADTLTTCRRCGVVAIAAWPRVRLAISHPMMSETFRRNMLLIHLVPLNKSDKIKRNTADQLQLQPFTYEEAVQRFGVHAQVHKSRSIPTEDVDRPDRYPLSNVVSMSFCQVKEHHTRIAVATRSGLIIVSNTVL